MSTANVLRQSFSARVQFQPKINQPTTAIQVRFELDQKFTRFSTDQRALAVMVLWEHNPHEDIEQVSSTVNLMVAMLGGDDHHYSVRFALALEITFHFIDDLGLSAGHRDELSGALNATDRDYQSTGREVRRIIEESRQAPKSAVEEKGTVLEQFSCASSPGSISEYAPSPTYIPHRQESVAAEAKGYKNNKPLTDSKLERSSSRSASEQSVRKSVKSRLPQERNSVHHHSYAPTDHSSFRGYGSGRLGREEAERLVDSSKGNATAYSAEESQVSSVVEYPSPSVGRRAKNAVSKTLTNVRHRFTSAREVLSDKFGTSAEAKDSKARKPAIEEDSAGDLPPENVSDLSFLEPRKPTVGERMKVKLTRVAGNTLEELSRVRSSLRSGVSWLKKPKVVGDQRSKEVMTEGTEALTNEPLGEDMARPETSGRRGSKHARRFGGSVATGVARGAKAVGGLLSKARDWVRDRSADAKGFERI